MTYLIVYIVGVIISAIVLGIANCVPFGSYRYDISDIDPVIMVIAGVCILVWPLILIALIPIGIILVFVLINNYFVKKAESKKEII